MACGKAGAGEDTLTATKNTKRAKDTTFVVSRQSTNLRSSRRSVGALKMRSPALNPVVLMDTLSGDVNAAIHNLYRLLGHVRQVLRF